MRRGFALFLAALFTALTLTACGGSRYGGGDSGSTSASTAAGGSPADSYAYGGAAEADQWKAAVEEWGFDAADIAEPAEAPDSAGEEQVVDRLANAKMVYTADIQAETMDFDASAAGLEALVERLGGYLGYASVSSRSDGARVGNYTARIPSARFSGFLKSVGELCHVTGQSKSAENISERYYDTESRLRTQETKLERLQMLLAKAENMEDIISLESAIAETELQIEQLTGTLRHYDALVDYATVEIQLREVLRLTPVEEAPPTFATRLGHAFSDGLGRFRDFLQDAAIFLAYNWIWLLLLALIAAVVMSLSKKRQAQRFGTFREAGQAREKKTLFPRKKPKNPDDKQEKD